MMSGSRCPACGLVNFAASEICRRCGQSLAGGQGISTGGLSGGSPPQFNQFSGQPGEQANGPSGFGNNQPPPAGQLGYVQSPAQFSAAEPASGPFSNVPPGPGSFGNMPPQPVAFIPPPPVEAATYARTSYEVGVQQAPYGYPVPRPANLRQGMAITSLIIGCLSPFSCALLGVGSIAGIVLGIAATVKATRYPAQYGGKPMAIIGIALNGFSIVVVIPIVLAIAIPNLLLSRMAANEASAIGTLRTIEVAEANYQSAVTNGKDFGSLEQLEGAGLVERGIQIKKGYRFEVRTTENRTRWGTEYRFEAFATPAAYNSTGRRSFYTNQDFVIRMADRSGRQASNTDPPIR